jgi:hypothetical protein
MFTSGTPNQTVMQVAAILIAAGVLLKLYQVQTRRGDDRAFRRLKREVDRLDVPSPDKDLLRRVLDLCRRLASNARAASSGTGTSGI